MTENLGYYARKGYVETGRGVQDGYRRVFFRKIVGSPPGRDLDGLLTADVLDGRSGPSRSRTPPLDG